MSLLSSLGRMFLGELPPDPTAHQTRAYAGEYPSLEQQIDMIHNRGRMTYRSASVDEALSVPAIFGAVSLIANTVGSLSLEAYRNGVLMEMEDAPRLIQRPNPFTTLREFLRDTAFHVASRGESWWWIAARDAVDTPLSLYPVPPWEIKVDKNERNRLRPTIRWGDREMRNEDMIHITYLRDRDGLRGVGPLQLCGASISVAVEAQEWAANFFSGALPSMIGTTEEMLTDDELAALDRQWLEKAPNLPRWLGAGVEVRESPFDPQKAQLNDSRQFNVGDVARMFNMPGSLIEYQMSGSSLRYQNQEHIWTDFQNRCLNPHYLEPIQAHISDLLTRATVARFNTDHLLRADPKTRMEVHQMAIASGIYDAEYAAREEGVIPGNVDFAPVPQASPQARPRLLPPNREPTVPRSAAVEVRCDGVTPKRRHGVVRVERCNKLLSTEGAFIGLCPRCKKRHAEVSA
jgi:HK97 family phage portal protein